MAIEHVLMCHTVTRLSSVALLSTSGRIIFKYRRVLILSQKMSDCISEQRDNIKFLVKLKKSAKETFQLLTEAYGEDRMSRACMFEWHKQFSEGRETLRDDDRPGCPCTAVTDNNTEKVRDVIRKDRRLGVRAVADKVNLDRESVRQILREELNTRKVCTKMVPKVLSDEQKECRKELCLDLLLLTQNEPDLLNSIITCDETWIFTYDLETK